MARLATRPTYARGFIIGIAAEHVRAVDMANDPPTSLRMGFGFLQARADWRAIRPRNGWEMDWDVANSAKGSSMN
jgi:hypothetical protein